YSGQTLGRRTWFLASAVLYAVGLFAKETAIMLPAVVAANNWIEQRDKPWTQRLKSLIKSQLLYFAPTLVYVTARVAVLKQFDYNTVKLSPLQTALTWPGLVWLYTRLLVWPVGLNEFYDLNYVTTFSIKEVGIPLVAILCGALLGFLCIRKVRAAQNRSVAVLMVDWTVLLLLPALYLAALHKGDFAHDRYLYLPSVGFSVLVALGVRGLDMSRTRLYGLPAVQVIMGCILALLLGMGTALQSAPWASN